tara:strand:- start:18 stop:1424 length:1407 start_codon:yes stop_codon:yes gene_type:complete
MDKLNVDINTYTLVELENLLKLSKDYDEEKIISKTNDLHEQINKSDLSQNKKEELYIFLDNIKNKLTTNYYSKLVNNKNINIVDNYGDNFLIKHENSKYESTLENNKKVNKSIIKKSYTIDSLFRPNYDNESNNYYIELPETITNAITMSISSIEIPLTYYNISSKLNNNVLDILIYVDDVVDISFQLELQDGLYESKFTNYKQTAANIETEINNQIEKNINNLITYYNSDDNKKSILNSLLVDNTLNKGFKFNINKTSGRGFFQYKQITSTNNNSGYRLNTDNNKIVINFNVNNIRELNDNGICYDNELYQKLGWQLGFRTKEITIINNGKDTIKETYLINANGINVIDYRHYNAAICNLNYPRYLYISIDDFQSSSRNYFSIASQSNIAPNIVSRINIGSCLDDKTAFKSSAAPGDYLYINKHIREYFGPTNIKKLQIQLLDEYGRKFSINNTDWSFIASWECYYD